MEGMRRAFGFGVLIGTAILLAACISPEVVRPTPTPTPSASPSPEVTAEPTPGPPPGTTPFPTPGATITPGSTRVIGTILHADGSPARGICVVLEKGLCPIATDEQGVWFTDVPAGPLRWNFIYKIGVDGPEIGRQFVVETEGGELRLGAYRLSD